LRSLASKYEKEKSLHLGEWEHDVEPGFFIIKFGQKWLTQTAFFASAPTKK